jgi:hypothetical protein
MMAKLRGIAALGRDFFGPGKYPILDTQAFSEKWSSYLKSDIILWRRVPPSRKLLLTKKSSAGFHVVPRRNLEVQ